MTSVLIMLLGLLAAALSGAYFLGRALPRAAAVLATCLIAAAAFIVWYVINVDPGDGPGAAFGIAIAGGLAGLAVLAAVGLIAGATANPGLIIGPGVGVVCAAILVFWPPARAYPGISTLAFVACCAVGGAWKQVRSLLRPDP